MKYDLTRPTPELEQCRAAIERETIKLKKNIEELGFQELLIKVELFSRKTGWKIGTILRNTLDGEPCVITRFARGYGDRPKVFIRKIKKNGEYYALENELYTAFDRMTVTGHDPSVEKMVEAERMEKKRAWV